MFYTYNCIFHIFLFPDEPDEDQDKDSAGSASKHDQKVFSDDEITNIVDMVLKEDDLNGDG